MPARIHVSGGMTCIRPIRPVAGVDAGSDVIRMDSVSARDAAHALLCVRTGRQPGNGERQEKQASESHIASVVAPCWLIAAKSALLVELCQLLRSLTSEGSRRARAKARNVQAPCLARPPNVTPLLLDEPIGQQRCDLRKRRSCYFLNR